MNDFLMDLGIKYGTDKVQHRYIDTYNSRFLHRRNEITKVLEVGIDTGASLRMFRDFFPCANIIGLDIVPERAISEDRIQSVIIDATKPFLGNILKECDKIIDDGSHVDIDIVKAFQNLFQFLKPNGTYIIEDVYSYEFGSTAVEYFKSMILSKVMTPGIYHPGTEIGSIEFQKCLIIITKKRSK